MTRRTMPEEGAVYFTPPIRNFEDTGFVTHAFKNGSIISTRVVPSGDFGGFAIELVVKDEGGEEVCNFTMDRFAALCVAEGIIKNLMNQEELIDGAFYRRKQIDK